MNLAAIVLLGLVFGLLVFDLLTLRGKNPRALILEALVFSTGAFFIVFPDSATTLAHRVGINRGVDFLLYPIVIWLVRESLVMRRRTLEDAGRITELTRALAIATGQAPSVQGSDGLQSPVAPAASTR